MLAKFINYNEKKKCNIQFEKNILKYVIYMLILSLSLSSLKLYYGTEIYLIRGEMKHLHNVKLGKNLKNYQQQNHLHQ